MSLPPFKELEIYAAGEADLPQRFYMDPEHEKFSDWKMTVAGKILPCHSPMIGIASNFFCGMLTDGPKPSGPIDLSGTHIPNMAQALALLRFIYERETMTEENIRHLVRHDDLAGVLRLAHKFDVSKVFEKCKCMTNDLLLLGPPQATEAQNGERNSSSAPLVKFDLVKDIREIYLDIKDDLLQEACYTYVSKWCYQTTSGGFESASFEDSAALVRELGDCPDLLRAGLFFMMHRNLKLTGKTIRRTFDLKEHLPPALFTFEYQITLDANRDGVRYTCTCPKTIHEEFCWGDYIFTPDIYDDGKKFYLENTLDIQADEAGAEIEVNFRIFNWTDPTQSIYKDVVLDYCYELMSYNDIVPFLDEHGVLYVQVIEEYKVVKPPAAANPLVIENEDNEGLVG